MSLPRTLGKVERNKRAIRSTLLWVPLVAATGCWKTEFSGPELEIVDFTPNAEAPADWVVTRQTVPLECPDGEDASFLFVYPDGHAPEEPLPVALMFHSGAFDFVYEADPQTPLSGLHYATPSRLDSGWAVKAAFSTLGMYPSEQVEEVHDGTLAADLTRRGYALLLPTNCWGDLAQYAPTGQRLQPRLCLPRRARRGTVDVQRAHDRQLREAIDLEMPFATDRDRVVWIGLGEGGRAVLELLHHWRI